MCGPPARRVMCGENGRGNALFGGVSGGPLLWTAPPAVYYHGLVLTVHWPSACTRWNSKTQEMVATSGTSVGNTSPIYLTSGRQSEERKHPGLPHTYNQF